MDATSFIASAQAAFSAATAPTVDREIQVIYTATARVFYERAKRELEQFAIVLVARERELQRTELLVGGAQIEIEAAK